MPFKGPLLKNRTPIPALLMAKRGPLFEKYLVNQGSYPAKIMELLVVVPGENIPHLAINIPVWSAHILLGYMAKMVGLLKWLAFWAPFRYTAPYFLH
jgi:hypothetical protein